MSIKADEKKENIQTIKKNIKDTNNNIEFANDIMDTVTDPEAKKELAEKNNRRMNEVRAMIKDVNDKVNKEYNL